MGVDTGSVLTPALGPDEDVRQVARRRRDALDRFVWSHVVPAGIRPVVASSWLRSAAAGACHDGDRLPPVRMELKELDDYRERHPLACLLPMLGELLGAPARAGEHLFALTDAGGTLLWVRGHSRTLAAAERMNFVEGASWSEQFAGTNAPGTALATGLPVQIFATEHFNTAVHRWSCSAAPIRDLASGQVLGVLDLTGGNDIAGPQALALVRATARLAEHELAASPERRHAGPDVRLTALGRDAARLELDGRVLRLTPRHSEILVALLLAPAGVSGERLAVQLSEHELHRSTIRAELTRLRAVLGSGLLGSAPYVLLRPMTSDFLMVRDLLSEGDLPGAVAAYTGPLLPASQAPVVTEYRDLLEQQLRGAVLASGDPALLRRWVNAPWGVDDAVAWRALADRLPGGSAQRAAAAARARALRQDVAAAVPAQRLGAALSQRHPA